MIGIEYDTGNLFNINPATAVATPIGTTGIKGMGDIQFGPDGNLYGFSSSLQPIPSLYSINLQTGVATDIGPLGLALVSGGGLAFGPDGTAYGVNSVVSTSNARQLFSINLTTGAASIIGTLGTGLYNITGLVYRSDGMLVGVDSLSNSLVVIDPTTGNVTLLAPLNFSAGLEGGMTTLDGVTYLATGGTIGGLGSDSLYTVDLFTGATTLISSFSPTFFDAGISGIAADVNLAPVPEPATSSLLTAVLSALVVLPLVRRFKAKV